MKMKINLFNYTITIKQRKRKTRKPTVRKSLTSPVAPKGYVHRWVRNEVLGRGRLKKYVRDHVLVKGEKYKGKFPYYIEGKFKGYIGMGGLVLAKIPAHLVMKELN